MAGTVLTVGTNPEDIEKFVQERLAPAVRGVHPAVVNAAFLSVIIQSMGPADITWDELVEGIQGASGWIVMYLSDLREAGRPN